MVERPRMMQDLMDRLLELMPDCEFVLDEDTGEYTVLTGLAEDAETGEIIELEGFELNEDDYESMEENDDEEDVA